MIKALLRHRHLFKSLIQRELKEKYQPNLLGWLWLVLRPLLYLLMFTFVFGVLFQHRWGGQEDESMTQFALVLFCGLSLFFFFADCVARSPGLILERVNLVKQVVFPLELVALVHVLNESLAFVAALLLILLIAPFAGFELGPNLFWLPVLFSSLVLFLTGVVWFLSATGVFLRDLGQIIAPVVQSFLFLSPVFYSLETVPEAYRALFYLNPLTFYIETLRQVMLFGESPDPVAVLIGFLASATVAYLGYEWFRRTRKGFADVL